MKFYYAGVLLACVSSTLLVQTTYSKERTTVKKQTYSFQRKNDKSLQNEREFQLKGPESIRSEADCAQVVNMIKNILTNKEDSKYKVSAIRQLAKQYFNIHQMTMKATSTIRKKHKMSDQDLSTLKSAIMTYLYNKYVKLTSDYNGEKNVTIKKVSNTGNKVLQKFNYVIQTGRKTLRVSVFVQNNKVTDVIFNNVSLIVPNSFAEKLDNEFKGNIAEFTKWLNRPSAK